VKLNLTSNVKSWEFSNFLLSALKEIFCSTFFFYFYSLSIKPIIHSSSLSTELKYSETTVKGISLSEIQASCCKTLTQSNLVKQYNGLTKKITYSVFCCGSSVLDSGNLHSPTYHFASYFVVNSYCKESFPSDRENQSNVTHSLPPIFY